MIYGMYLSATGVMTASHQQDVIANNLANAETGGFKRQLEIQSQRQVESKVAKALGEDDGSSDSDSDSDSGSMFDAMGGGQLTGPSYVDFSQGDLEPSANNFDTAIDGKGFMTVKDGDDVRLSRAGSLMIDKNGNLITNNGQAVLDTKQKPIKLAGFAQQELRIEPDGSIKNLQDTIAKINLVQPTDDRTLRHIGRNLFATTDKTKLEPATGRLRNNMLEKANVDPTTEITRLMEAQRLLEANANMIRYQDQSLGLAVSDLGKIS